jgi:multiple sugar transport system permease protein
MIYYMPVVTTIVAAALMFQWLFDRNYGVVSAMIWDLGVTTGRGIQPPDWFNDSGAARWAVVILTLWKNVGFTTVIYLAGLQAIPRDLYEAAAIDGAGAWQRLRAVTLPLLSGTTFFALIILCIGAFQLFGESFILTRGGPGYATMTVVQYIYQSAFEFFRMGRATAAAWLLFLAIFAFTALQLRLQRRWVYYETEGR